jgi:dinuclear metal center YbgI/SA1388 family protein
MAVDRDELVAAMDRYLDLEAVADESVNGLQVEGAVSIERVALAVDAAEATIADAISEGCQLLLVHHGLFWGEPMRLTGPLAARLRACFRADLSLYAAHLPLDRHPEVGNNAVLVARLGGTVEAPFGEYGGASLGVLASLDAPCDVGAIAGRLAALGCEEPLIWSFGPETISKVAIVSGAACFLVQEAAAAGADCFVTGEPRHSQYHSARELGIHCVFGGHYVTETFGVRALGDWLTERYDIETVWIDHPTGI